MKQIHSEKAPQAVGPYSQAIVSNGLIFCAGQIGINPTSGEFAGDSIDDQTIQIFSNIKAILEEAGSSLDKIVTTVCYLKNMNHYTKFNEVYGRFFTMNKPARTTIEVSNLPRNALVEITVTATIN